MTRTFRITDLIGTLETVDITVTASTLPAAKIAAHVAATCRGFDNDFLKIVLVVPAV